MKKRAMVITAFIVLVFAASVFAVFSGSIGKSGNYACVYQGKELLYTIDLSNVSEPYKITVTGAQGGYNVLEIRQGAIGVVDASCPDKICQSMGFISSSIMPVTCLPNHLVIQISSKEPDQGQTLDGIAY